MVGVARDLCGSSSPTPLPKQGHPQQAAQDCIQAGLEYLQRRRLHNLPGQPVPGLRHPQREEVLPRVQLELPVLQLVFSFILPTAHKKSLHAFKSAIFLSYLDFGSHLCCTYTMLPCAHTKGSQQRHRRTRFPHEELGGGKEGRAFPSRLHHVVIHLSHNLQDRRVGPSTEDS